MNKFERDRNWGTIQKLEVEADTLTALRGAIMIATVDHTKVSHFRIENITEEREAFDDEHRAEFAGANKLTLMWAGDKPTDNELPFELVTVDEITEFVAQWLEKKGQWPTEMPDTDGSVQRGFRIENSWSPFYTVIKVTPIWIVYGK